MGLIKQVVLIGLSSGLAAGAVYRSELASIFTEDPNEDLKNEVRALELEEERYELQANILVQKAQLRERQLIAQEAEAEAQARVDRACELSPELMKVVMSKTEDLFELDSVAREVLGLSQASE